MDPRTTPRRRTVTADPKTSPSEKPADAGDSERALHGTRTRDPFLTMDGQSSTSGRVGPPEAAAEGSSEDSEDPPGPGERPQDDPAAALALLAEAEYASLRSWSIELAKLAGALDLQLLDRLIATAERSQAVGPILDPTLARDAGPALDQELRIFHAVRALAREVQAVRSEARP